MQKSAANQETREVTSPPTFKDSAGRTWTIKLTLSLIDRVLIDTEIDLIPDNGNYEPIFRLVQDIKKLGRVLWECSRAQAERENITFESFADALDGPTYFAGWTALQDAIHFFTLSLKGEAAAKAFEVQAEAVLRLLRAEAETTIAVIQAQSTDDAINKAVTEIQQKMTTDLAQELGNSVSKLPALSRSVPARTR